MAGRYKITSINRRSYIAPNGLIKDGYEIAFETASGVADTVKIPLESFNKETVKAEVEKAVSNIESILKLEG